MRKIPRIQGIKSLQYFLSLIFRPSQVSFSRVDFVAALHVCARAMASV